MPVGMFFTFPMRVSNSPSLQTVCDDTFMVNHGMLFRDHL